MSAPQIQQLLALQLPLILCLTLLTAWSFHPLGQRKTNFKVFSHPKLSSTVNCGVTRHKQASMQGLTVQMTYMYVRSPFLSTTVWHKILGGSNFCDFFQRSAKISSCKTQKNCQSAKINSRKNLVPHSRLKNSYNPSQKNCDTSVFSGHVQCSPFAPLQCC